MAISLRSPLPALGGWTFHYLIDHQDGVGVRPVPRLAGSDADDPLACFKAVLQHKVTEIVADYLSRPLCADEAAMPLSVLRLWLRWRWMREAGIDPHNRPSRYADRVHHEDDQTARRRIRTEADEMLVWLLNQPHSGLYAERLKRRAVAA